MIVTFKRAVDPYSFDYAIALDNADISAAFFDQLDPNEDLFYQLFSPQWSLLSVSEQLAALSQVAVLVESAQQAESLNLVASPPQPKG